MCGLEVWILTARPSCNQIPGFGIFFTLFNSSRIILEKTLESHLNCKEIQPGNPKGNKPWVFIGSTVAEAEAPRLWPRDAQELNHWKKPWCWERLKAKKKGTIEEDMVGWHHQFNVRESEQTLGDSGEQRSLACCNPWCYKKSDTT